MLVSIMIEGQNGLNWPRWMRMVKAVEELGYHGLFRSDHFVNPSPPDLDLLELWVSLTWLAANTHRIAFGPLVTPFSFRQPTMTARMAAAVDDLSMGRLILGLGAGWQEREHHNYGWDLLGPKDRFDRFEEGVEVVTRLLDSDQPVHFSGKYYHIGDAVLLPRPHRRGGPSILIGGSGPRRTLPIAARYASVWNAVFLTPQRFAEVNKNLNELLIQVGRAPAEVHRSLMTSCWVGKDESQVVEKAALRKKTVPEIRSLGAVIGTPAEIVAQLGALAEAGVQQVMLQWLDLDDLAGLELMAAEVLPQVQG